MDTNVKDKLEELFISYKEKLPQKIQAIELRWLALTKNWDSKQFEVFHRDVHSLCGSAGTYGYLELSKQARQMEIFLKSIEDTKIPSPDQKETVEHFISQLQLTLLTSLGKKPSIVLTETLSDNKLIYILEQDESLVSELCENLKYAGYTIQVVEDLQSLQQQMQNQPPIGIILDADYLDYSEMDGVLGIQKQQQPALAQLFCIVPNGDLLPRIKAVRAGCSGFFQKPVDVFYFMQTLNQKCSIIGESYRILIVDDSHSLAEYYSLVLSEAGMVTQAISDPMQLLEALDNFKPDLLLMDVYMPECTGLELAAVLRKESRYMKLPIIFLSTEDDKRRQLSALSLGGDDFLTKPISAAHLISAVRSRSKRAGVLNYYMTTDSLTGLLNHSSILKQLEIELESAKQRKLPLSVIMIDIDHFKNVNDTFGHPLGDIVIKKLATLLLARLRSQDIVGRYGGEEFAIILPGATAEKSKERCDDLREYFSNYQFTVDDAHFFVTISAGVSAFNDDFDDAKSLIDKADKALYQAKDSGRNQVTIYRD